MRSPIPKGYVAIDEKVDLWVFNRVEKKLTRLTRDMQGYRELQWSPNGRYVSAFGLRGWTTPDMPPTLAGVERDDLYVWDTRTGNRILIARNVENSEWMPNSRGLLTVNLDDDLSYYRLYVWRPGNGKSLVLEHVGEDATWERDGKGILFTWSASRTVNLVDPLSKRVQTICPVSDRVFFQQWSPEGEMVVLWLPGYSKLALLRVKSQSCDEIVSGAHDFSCAWSSDSTKLAVAYHDAVPDMQTYYTMLTVIPMATQKGKVLSAFAHDAQVLGWTKDNSTIIILHIPYKREKVNGQMALTPLPQRIVAVDASTGDKEDLATLPANASFADWRLVNNRKL